MSSSLRFHFRMPSHSPCLSYICLTKFYFLSFTHHPLPWIIGGVIVSLKLGIKMLKVLLLSSIKLFVPHKIDPEFCSYQLLKIQPWHPPSHWHQRCDPFASDGPFFPLWKCLFGVRRRWWPQSKSHFNNNCRLLKRPETERVETTGKLFNFPHVKVWLRGCLLGRTTAAQLSLRKLWIMVPFLPLVLPCPLCLPIIRRLRSRTESEQKGPLMSYQKGRKLSSKTSEDNMWVKMKVVNIDHFSYEDGHSKPIQWSVIRS